MSGFAKGSVQASFYIEEEEEEEETGDVGGGASSGKRGRMEYERVRIVVIIVI